MVHYIWDTITKRHRVYNKNSVETGSTTEGKRTQILQIVAEILDSALLFHWMEPVHISVFAHNPP